MRPLPFGYHVEIRMAMGQVQVAYGQAPLSLAYFCPRCGWVQGSLTGWYINTVNCHYPVKGRRGFVFRCHLCNYELAFKGITYQQALIWGTLQSVVVVR